MGYFCTKICHQGLSKIAQCGHTFLFVPFMKIKLAYYSWPLFIYLPLIYTVNSK